MEYSALSKSIPGKRLRDKLQKLAKNISLCRNTRLECKLARNCVYNGVMQLFLGIFYFLDILCLIIVDIGRKISELDF